jgi:hypothetical protein
MEVIHLLPVLKPWGKLFAAQQNAEVGQKAWEEG